MAALIEKSPAAHVACVAVAERVVLAPNAETGMRQLCQPDYPDIAVTPDTLAIGPGGYSSQRHS